MLTHWLAKKSKFICAENHCTDDNHKCDSFAYIDADLTVLDVCCPDYFTGTSKPHAAIPLPWHGTQAELEAEVEVQCESWLEGMP